MPYTQLWVHYVWSTKHRVPMLTAQLRGQLFAHIKTNALAKNISLNTIGGHIDHVHVLVEMKASQSPSFVMQNLKGESAHWVNAERLTQGKFEWQDDYFALSVSPRNAQAVRQYILRQEEHHRVRTFQEEYDRIMIEALLSPT